MVDHFFDRFGVRIDMSNGGCYIISILVPKTIITELVFVNTLMTILLSFQRWANLLSLHLQLA